MTILIVYMNLNIFSHQCCDMYKIELATSVYTKKVDSEVSLRNWHLVSRYERDEVRLHRIGKRLHCGAVKMDTC